MSTNTASAARDFYPAILLSARKEYVDQLDEMMWRGPDPDA